MLSCCQSTVPSHMNSQSFGRSSIAVNMSFGGDYVQSVLSFV